MSDKEYLENIIKTCLKESVDEYLDADFDTYGKIAHGTANKFLDWYHKTNSKYDYGIEPNNGRGIPSTKNLIVYHSCKPENLKGISENGFSREYNDEVGNCYGSGVYTTFTPSNRTSGYGRAIIKCLLIDGLKDFIIFPNDIRRMFRGDGVSLADEIENVSGIKNNPELRNEILRRTDYIHYSLERNSSGERIGSDRNAGHFTDSLRGRPLYHPHQRYDEILLNQSGIRGFVYRDGHGLVVLVRDFNSLIPYQCVPNRDYFNIGDWRSVDKDNHENSWSTWKGNWKDIITDPETYNRINNDTDVYYKYSGKYPGTNPMEKQSRGYARVKDGRGYNYVNVKTGEELLPYPAQSAEIFTDEGGDFVYNRKRYTVTVDPETGETSFYSPDELWPMSKEDFIEFLNAE